MADRREHPADGDLLALLDGELGDERRRAVEAHAEGCGRCADRLDALAETSERLSGALAVLDVPPPAVEPARIAARARGGPGPWTGGEDSRRGAALLKAAALVLAFAGAAAAAVPGSPVRDWLSDLMRDAPAVDGDAPRAEQGEAGPDGIPGVAVEMEGGRIAVLVSGAPPGTPVNVRLADGTEAGVWARGGRYRTAPGRIEVLGPSPEEILVEIPRTAVEARVSLNGRTVWTKEGGEVRAEESSRLPAGDGYRFRAGGSPSAGESPG